MKKFALFVVMLALVPAGPANLRAAERVAGAAVTVTTPDAIRILPLKVGQHRLYDSDPLREIEKVSGALAGWQFTSIPQRIENAYQVRVTKPGYLYAFGGNKSRESRPAESVFGPEASKWETAEGEIGGKNVWFCYRRKVATGEELTMKAFELQLAAAAISTPEARPVRGAPPETTPDAISGRWKMGDTIWIVSSDGRATRSKPGFHEDGHWKCTSTATPPTYEFNWGGGRQVESFHLSTGRDKILNRSNQVVGERARAD
jgi:hypothetical protein